MDDSTGERPLALGLDQYKNTETLSDVVIKYGKDSELSFRGHKVVLCRESRWFQVAFTGNFKESSSNEITLHDDDPNALEALLSFPYWDRSVNRNPTSDKATDPETEEPETFELKHPFIDSILSSQGLCMPDETYEKSALDAILQCIRIGKVADKYDCPRLLATAAGAFETALQNMLFLVAHLISHDGIKNEKEDKDWTNVYGSDLLAIVKEVYKVAASNDNPMLKTLLLCGRRMIISEGIQAPYHFGASLQTPFTFISQEVAEFGRDVLQSAFEASEGHLAWAKQSKCKRCKKRYEYLLSSPHTHGTALTELIFSGSDDPIAIDALLRFPYTCTSEESDSTPDPEVDYDTQHYLEFLEAGCDSDQDADERNSKVQPFINSILILHGFLPPTFADTVNAPGHLYPGAIRTCARIGEVANRYDTPKLLQQAASAFGFLLQDWFHSISLCIMDYRDNTPFAESTSAENYPQDWDYTGASPVLAVPNEAAIHDAAATELLGIVQSVYSWTSDRKNPMLKALIFLSWYIAVADDDVSGAFCWDNGLKVMFLAVAQQAAEYGRDVMVSALEANKKGRVLAVAKDVHCKYCGHRFRRLVKAHTRGPPMGACESCAKVVFEGVGEGSVNGIVEQALRIHGTSYTYL